MTRLLGAVLLACGGGLWGWSRCQAEGRKEKLLGDLSAALEIMGDELRVLRRPLPEIFSLLASRGPEELRAFFALLSSPEGDVPFRQRWQQALHQLPIRAQERAVLEELGSVLGRYDCESQLAALSLACRRLESAARQLHSENLRRTRLWPGMGACAGAMLSVILM